jgi:hypothetical protein
MSASHAVSRCRTSVSSIRSSPTYLTHTPRLCALAATALHGTASSPTPAAPYLQCLPADYAIASPLLEPFLPIFTTAELHFWPPFFRHHQSPASHHLTAFPSQPSKNLVTLKPLAIPPQHRIA